MSSFYFQLIYQLTKDGNQEALKVLKKRKVNLYQPAVIGGVYYPSPSFKLAMEQQKSVEFLLNEKLFSLYQEVISGAPIKRGDRYNWGDGEKPVTVEKKEDVELPFPDIDESNLSHIVNILAGCGFLNELQNFYAKLRQEFTDSLEKTYSADKKVISESSQFGISLAPVPIEEFKKGSKELFALRQCIHQITYGFALRGETEALDNFYRLNKINSTEYPLNHNMFVKGLARGGHLDKIESYIIKNKLKNDAHLRSIVIGGLIAASHYSLLEKYCLDNKISIPQLSDGFVRAGAEGKMPTDEDGLRMLVEAKNDEYRQMLCETLSGFEYIDTGLKLGGNRWKHPMGLCQCDSSNHTGRRLYL